MTSTTFSTPTLRCTLTVLIAWLALGVGADDFSGAIEAQYEGRTVQFPLLDIDIDADIQGDLATVTVRQTFVNPLDAPVNARYLFPLNQDAAVFRMIMRTSDEVVEAVIREKQQARKTFAQAKTQGKAAALVEQQRPNMFTQRLANLMPGSEIAVELQYVQTVPKRDGAYELVIPLLVGPRYDPGGPAGEPFGVPSSTPSTARVTSTPNRAATGHLPQAPDIPLVPWDDWYNNLLAAEPAAPAKLEAQSITPHGGWRLNELPAYPPVAGLHLPGTIERNRVAIDVELTAAVPVISVASDTHELTFDGPRVTLANRAVDNRDFVLRYQLAGQEPSAGVLSFSDERGGFFSLMIEPPALAASDNIVPREMVFVLDCSGSMAGLPMAASRAFMQEALVNLRPTDHFRIIRFSDAATEFSSTPLLATPENVRRGLTYARTLQGYGGTRVTSGINQALSAPSPAGALRIVVFLTDGYIGNEAEVLGLTDANLGNARLFAFGVGTGVNRYLLDEMARIGRGFVRYMDPTEDVHETAKALATRLDAPVLTDITIDWGELAPTDVTPAAVPDLFLGDSIRIQGRYDKPGTYPIVVAGNVPSGIAELAIDATLQPAGDGDAGEAIGLVWARSSIADAMHELTLHEGRRPSGSTDSALQQQVTDLGLDFGLVTRWTSLLAVSKRVVNHDPAAAVSRDVPLPKGKGVPASAYSPASSAQFTGHAAPEPGVWAALLFIGACFAVFWRRSVSGSAVVRMREHA